jgi:ABC-type glycerol-3-phosphate transport system permease component
MAVTAQEKELTRAQPVQKSVSRTLMNLSGRTLVYAILILGAILFIAPGCGWSPLSFQPRGDIFNWPPHLSAEHFTLEITRISSRRPACSAGT